MIKSFLNKITPRPILALYHLTLAKLASWYYAHPSSKMLVIGITGTNGKTTTCNLAAAIFEAAGHTVGLTTTANFKIGSKTWLNDKKMTMLGRFQLQKLLSEMVQAGCDVAIIETSSLGIAQYRHIGINYDVAAFTKLSPEHIEAHGSFEAYQAAKGKLFAWLTEQPRKLLAGRLVEKVSVVNVADDHAAYFLNFPTDRKFGYRLTTRPATIRAEETAPHYAELLADHVSLEPTGSTFNITGTPFTLKIPGDFNIENALAAIAIAQSQGINLETCARGLVSVAGVPGRLERIEAGQPYTVIVDYAPEPASFAKLYEVVATIPHQRIIHLFGSAGGGRDTSRRPILGHFAGTHADICIIANEDPYDEDPQQIIEQVAVGAREAGKVEGESLFLITDRRAAIAKAISLAQPGDIVLFTGKGAEQAIVGPNNQLDPWDERIEVRKAITKQLAITKALS